MAEIKLTVKVTLEEIPTKWFCNDILRSNSVTLNHEGNELGKVEVVKIFGEEKMKDE